MAFAEQFDPFFDDITHGFAVVVSFSAANVGNVNAIWDDGYLEVPIGDAGVESVQPMIHCRTADVANVSESSAMSYGGTNYTVKNIQPDGTGTSTLHLRKAP